MTSDDRDDTSLLKSSDVPLSPKSSSAGSKLRFGVLLKEMAGGEASPNHNPELEALKVKYQKMCKQLKVLGKSLVQRHQALVATAKARREVSKAFSALNADSPLSKQSGTWEVKKPKKSPKDKDKEDAKTPTIPSKDVATVVDLEEPKGSKSCYAKSMSSVAIQAEERAEEFEKTILTYFSKYRETLMTRADADIKKTDQLRRDADHYLSKVEGLRATNKKAEERGKPVTKSMKDKLKRNQHKMEEATIVYNNAALDLFLLLEEVVVRSWRDIQPLFADVLQWDIDTHEDDALVVGHLKSTVESLTYFAHDERIQPTRLPELAKESPRNFTTRPGGVESVTFEFGTTVNPETSAKEEMPLTEALRSPSAKKDDVEKVALESPAAGLEDETEDKPTDKGNMKQLLRAPSLESEDEEEMDDEDEEEESSVEEEVIEEELESSSTSSEEEVVEEEIIEEEIIEEDDDDDEDDDNVEIARYDSGEEEEDVVSKTIRWADEVDDKGHRRHPSDEVNRTPTAFGLELD